MPSNYDFKSLSFFDFEQLIRDLLQKEWEITLESFKTGRDNGIDLRYSKDIKETRIVQCKHYLNTSYATLISKLRREELPKIKELDPARYVFATSLGLTPQNKDELFLLLNPFCKSTADILGQDDINNLISKYPDVERSHFKLWLTSQPVLDRILHNYIYIQTDAEKELIERKVKLYVKNNCFKMAVEKLNDFGFVIISGIPGIGKTTLAEMLILFFLDKGFNFYKISKSIDEAKDVFITDKKQLFYYDDFLGAVSLLNDKLTKNEDNAIAKFIELIVNSRKKKCPKRLILTTREYILKQALQEYEKLDNASFEASKTIIELKDYSEYQKAEILYNHLFFSDLPMQFKTKILDNKAYLKIIRHENYSPRIIEWMTDYRHIDGVTEEEYVDFFIYNLDHPTKLWSHAFKTHISLPSRVLLIVLCTFNGKVEYNILKKAFDLLYKDLIKKYSYLGLQNGIDPLLKELDETFIKISAPKSREKERQIAFHNPSIQDFLDQYLIENIDVMCDVLENAMKFEQAQKIVHLFLRKNEGVNLKNCYGDFVKKIAETLSNLINKPTYEVVNTSLGRGRRQIDTPYESRVELIIMLTKNIDDKIINNLFRKSIDGLRVYTRENETDFRKLYNICNYLVSSDVFNIKEKEIILSEFEEYLIKSLDDANDTVQFDVVWNFFENIRGGASIETIGILGNQLEKFANSECNNVCWDPEHISIMRDEASDIGHLGELFNVDVEEYVYELRSKADSLEKESVDYEYEYEYDYSERKFEERDESQNILIESMFESLKESL